jgi:uncharacterized protein YbaP (TraB family)
VADEGAQENYGGFLWEARKGDRHTLLMGTLHFGRGESDYPLGRWGSDYPLERLTQQLLFGADAIVLEAYLPQSERAAMRARALYGQGELGLDARIDAALKADTVRALGRFGFSTEDAWRMKPWALVAKLQTLLAAQDGYSPSYGTEEYLASLASASGKPIIELEGVNAQFDLLDAPTWAEQVAFLQRVVQSILDGEAERKWRALVAAWRSSDAAAMQDCLQRVLASPDPAERVMFDRLVTARNPSMADRIDGLLQDGRFYLVAVGSMHYFGSGGLLEELMARGYAITPIIARDKPGESLG